MQQKEIFENNHLIPYTMEFIQKHREKIDTEIQNFLQKYFSDTQDISIKHLEKAVRYSASGGKRLRALLAIIFFSLFADNKNSENLKKLYIAIELLHSYSLVHDDLPAMDNDEYRRGKLTCWKKYGETNAILVGDLLNSLSFEIISEIGYPELTTDFGNAIGVNGMLGGQVMDLYYEKYPQNLSKDILEKIHDKKTGALIAFSIVGAIKLSFREQGKLADAADIKKYEAFGKTLGLAFQIKDDILDAEGTFEETGKSVGGEKKGFVYFLGIEKTKAILKGLIQECIEISQSLGSKELDFIIKYIETRKK